MRPPTPPTVSKDSRKLPAALLVLAAAVGAGLASWPLQARAAPPAADPAVLDSITKLNKKALEQYDNLSFDEAQETLISALELCTTNGLEDHPIKARTLVNLGVVVLAGGPMQHDDAIKQFAKALAVQPDIKLTDRVANPEVQQAFEEAKAAFAKSAAADAARAQASADKLPSAGIKHDPVTTGVKANAIPITVTTAASLGAKKVVLSVRAGGASDFVARDLKETSPGAWSGAIPDAATTGDEVAYTIRVENAAHAPVAGLGSAAAPLIVKLSASTPRVPVASDNNDNNDGSDNDDDSGPPAHTKPVEPPDWFLGLGVGTGFGWASGYGDVNNTIKVTPQFGLAKLGHVLPEVGYFVSQDVLLSLQVRWQAVSGATPVRDPMMVMCGSDHICNPASGALAVFGRLTRIFGDTVFRPYLSGLVGAGQIRHLASFPNATDCGTNPSAPTKCVDTVTAGPIFVGPGGGFFINATPTFALTLGVNTLLGFSAFTFHVDFNAGVALEL